jgi:hypothetical protein
VTATLPTEHKVLGQTWDENKHPRDSKGRFIETGAEVRIFGGWLGKVLRNVGGGNIEVQRTDGKSVIVNRNYLTVTKRPDGSAPTSDEHQATDIEEGKPDPNAEKIDPPEGVQTPTAGLQEASDRLDTALTAANLDNGPQVTAARDAYVQAVNNGVPNDEADERAKLLDVLDEIDNDQSGDPQYVGSDLHKAIEDVRAAATQEPEETLPGTVANPAPNSRHLVETIDPAGVGQTNDGHANPTTVRVGDSLRDQSGRTGWVVGFTPAGGPIMRDQNGNDWPYKDDALAQGHITLTSHDDPSVKPMPSEWTGGQPLRTGSQPTAPEGEAPPEPQDDLARRIVDNLTGSPDPTSYSDADLATEHDDLVHDQGTFGDRPDIQRAYQQRIDAVEAEQQRRQADTGPVNPDNTDADQGPVSVRPAGEPDAGFPIPNQPPAPGDQPEPATPEQPAGTERVGPDQLAEGDRIHLTYGAGMATVQSVDRSPRGGYTVTMQRDAGGRPMVLTMRSRDTVERDVRQPAQPATTTPPAPPPPSRDKNPADMTDEELARAASLSLGANTPYARQIAAERQRRRAQGQGGQPAPEKAPADMTDEEIAAELLPPGQRTGQPTPRQQALADEQGARHNARGEEEMGRADAQRTAADLAEGDRVMVDGKPATISSNQPGREHGANRALSGTFDDGQPLNREFPGDTRFDPAPAERQAAISPERQRILDALEAAKGEDGVDAAQARRIQAVADLMRGDTLDDDQAKVMADLLASGNTPGARTLREHLAGPGEAPEDQPAGGSIESQPSEPVTLPYMRNPQPLSSNQAANHDFGQDTEPAGRYITEATPGSNVPDGWQSGNVHFEHPLHMDFGGGYSEDSNWKNVLSAHYGGKTGQALSDAVRADGYDGIITHDKYGTSEIVDLTNGEGDRRAASLAAGAGDGGTPTNPPTPESPEPPSPGSGDQPRIPEGTAVRATQPGIENVTEGTLTGYDDNGMAQVQYTDRHGAQVTGTFNPSHVERADTAADQPDDPNNPPEGVRGLTWGLLTPEQRSQVRQRIADGADPLQAVRDVRAESAGPDEPTPEKPYVPPIARFGRDQADVEAAGWTFNQPTTADLAVNQHVVMHSRGQYREARIVSIGRTNVTVEYTTEGAVQSMRDLRDWARGKSEDDYRAEHEANAAQNYDRYVQWAQGEFPHGVSRGAGQTQEQAEAEATRQAQEFLAAHPDRAARVSEVGDSAVASLRKQAAWTDQDLYVNAHRTTKTIKASSVATRNDLDTPGMEEPGPKEAPAGPPTIESIQASLTARYEAGGYAEEHYQHMQELLSNPRTTIRPDGLVIVRDPSRAQWAIASPDGAAVIWRANDEEGAQRFADALGRITTVDEGGNKTDQPFDWTSPGVQARINDYNTAVEDTVHPPLGTVIRNIVSATDLGSYRSEDWPDVPVSVDDDFEEDVTPDEGGALDEIRDAADDLDMSAEQIAAMFNYTHAESGWYTDFSDGRYNSQTYDHTGARLSWEDKIVFSGTLHNADGEQVGSITRSIFRNNDGQLEAHHDLLVIESEYQGQGFADAYYKHLYDGYERNGVDVVTIQANIDVGGYAWAQRGFDWDPDTDDRQGGNTVRRNAEANLTEALRRTDLTAEQKARITAFRDFIAENDYEKYTPKQIANALRDIEWTETTSRGHVVKMWPGKKALLGSNWHGKFYVNDEARQTPDLEANIGTGQDQNLPDLGDITIPDTVVGHMSDEALAAEASANADALNTMVGTHRLSLNDSRVSALIARQSTVSEERQRRVAATMVRLIPDGHDAPAADLKPGDQVVVPIVSSAGPSIVTVASVERRPNDDGWLVTVTSDDGTSTPLYMVGALEDLPFRRGNPVSTQARASLLVDGDNIILDDGTVAHIDSIEDDDDRRILSLSTDTGPLEYEIDANSVVTIHPGGATDGPPEPGPDPLPPYIDPSAMTDADLTDEIETLGSIGIGGMDDEQYGRWDALVQEQNRRAAARTVEPDPVSADEKGTVARPRLYTYQRQAVNALGIDVANSTHDPVAKQAAARVRARMPLTHAQSVALASTIRQMNDGNQHHLTFGVRNTRKYDRLAQAFDVSAAVAIGRQDPEFQPIQPHVTRWKPTGFTEGDQIVLRSHSGSLDSFKVRAAQTMMRGTVVKMELEAPDGTVHTRLVDRDNDAWLMPDLPEPEIVSPTQEIDQNPTRELARVEDLNVGDTVAWSTTVFGSTDSPSATIQSITHDADGDPIFHTDRGDFPGSNGTLVTREARAQASYGQPVIQTFAPTADTIKGSDVRVGDYIQEPSGQKRGTVIGIDQIEYTRGDEGITDTAPYARIMQGDGTVVRIPLVNRGEDANIFREATAADNLSAGLTDRLRRQHDDQVTAAFRGYTRAVQDRASRSAQALLEDFDRGVEANPDYARDSVLRAIAANANAFENRSTAGRLSKELALLEGRDEYDERIKTNLESAIRQLADDRFRSMYSSLLAPPLNGETRQEADRRVLEQWASNPPRRDSAAIGDALRAAIPTLRGVTPETETPEYDKSTLRGRMQAYRARLGGGSGVFGNTVSRQAQFGTLDFDKLEAGETPDIQMVESATRMRAADGGPSQQAMDDLETVKAAGKELDDLMQARINEITRDNLPTIPGLEPLRDGETADQYSHRVKGEIQRLSEAETDLQAAVFDARNAEADKYISTRSEYADRADVERRKAIIVGFNGYNDPEARELSSLLNDAQVAAFETPAYTEAKAALQEARDASAAAKQVQANMRKAIADAQRQAALEALEGLRGFGGTRLDYQQADVTRQRRYGSRSRNRGDGASLTERHRLVRAMRQAEAVYPTDWLNAIRDGLPNTYHGRTTIGLAAVQRGHADYSGNIRLSSSDFRVSADESGFGGVATHELGHFAQRAVPGLMAAEEAFLWSRTSSGEVGSRERTATARGRAMHGDSSQMGYPDEFPMPYTGVDYARSRGGSEAWEVITTGMESMMNGSPYLDQDFRRWLLGTLALV